MKLIIDIPDGAYEELKTANFPVQDAYRLVAWIKNGTPLPKEHGRLIDADKLNDRLVDLRKDEYYSNKHEARLAICSAQTVVDNAPTIIKAESEVQNDK